MSEPYTPTTDEVRMRFRHGHMLVEQEGTLEAFDRWYSAERAKWEKEVLEQAAERARTWRMDGDGSQYGMTNEALADDLAAAVRGDAE